MGFTDNETDCHCLVSIADILEKRMISDEFPSPTVSLIIPDWSQSSRVKNRVSDVLFCQGLHRRGRGSEMQPYEGPFPSPWYFEGPSHGSS